MRDYYLTLRELATLATKAVLVTYYSVQLLRRRI